MRFFIDTEFQEDGKTIDLISLGMVAEDGRELYVCNTDARLDLVSDWVRANVLPGLPPYAPLDPKNINGGWMHRHDIKDAVYEFVHPRLPHKTAFSGTAELHDFYDAVNDVPKRNMDKPEFWAIVSATDWVALYQLWGILMDRPKGWPMWCHELKQLHETVGKHIELPPKPPGRHNALVDARWNRDVYNVLTASQQRPCSCPPSDTHAAAKKFGLSIGKNFCLLCGGQFPHEARP